MQKMTTAQQQKQVELMEQSLLEDRFQLKLHFETRDMPVYALVVSKGGPKLSLGREGEPSRLTTLRTDKGNELIASEVTLDDFVHSPLLTGPAGARPVLDHTGLKGTYNFTLKWSSELTDPGGDAPSFFTAIQEQLGLRLVAFHRADRSTRHRPHRAPVGELALRANPQVTLKLLRHPIPRAMMRECARPPKLGLRYRLFASSHSSVATTHRSNSIVHT